MRAVSDMRYIHEAQIGATSLYMHRMSEFAKQTWNMTQHK
jgi:hypothetical protein